MSEQADKTGIPMAMQWEIKRIKVLQKETITMTPNKTQDVKPGQTIIVDLPYNSKIDLSSFSWFYDGSTTHTSFNDFSIEAGILLRGNGAPRAMPDRHMFKLLAYDHPDVVAYQFSSPTHTYSSSLLPLSYTHLHAVYLHPLPHLGPASLCSLALKRLFSR